MQVGFKSRAELDDLRCHLALWPLPSNDMADPAALSLQVGVLITNLIEYGHEVKGAQDQITSLCRELSALRGVLEDIKAQRSKKHADNGISDCLATARLIIDDLLHRMQPAGSRFQRGKQSWLWPFKQKEIEQVLARLGRINTSIIMIMMGAQQSVALDMQVLKDELRSVSGMISAELYSQKQKEIISFLAPVSPKVPHDEACSIWEGTHSGTWFVDILQPWLDTPYPQKSIMVLHGSSGAGKTTVISKAIEYITVTVKTVKLGYFYCRFNDEATQNVRNILGSWIAQIAAYRPSVLDRFSEAVSSKERLSTAWWEDALVQVAEELGPVILVLDAVNESKDDDAVRSCLMRLATRCQEIRFVISSTPFAEEVFSSKCLGVPMDSNEVDDDIEQYVRRTVRRSPILVQTGEADIVAVIVPQARGMFRWAECQMNLLSGCLTAKMVKKSLAHLPGSLDSTYIDILKRIPSATRPWVREVLMWLSYAYRPLTLVELAEAVVIEPSQSSIDDSCRIQPPEMILRLCKGLVTHNTTMHTVSLAHSSVRATLESETLRTSEVAEFWLSRNDCTPGIITKSLTYLLMDDFNLEVCDCEQMELELCHCFDTYPFLDYAGTMWAVHASMYIRSGATLREAQIRHIFALLGTSAGADKKPHFALWIRIIVEGLTEAIQNATPLYYAASFGLEPIVEIMLSQGLVDFNNARNPSYIDWKSGRNDCTPLGVAVFRGHIGVVQLLLCRGANPNATDAFGNSCLNYAVLDGDQDMIALLRRHGAEGPTDATVVTGLMASRGYELGWWQIPFGNLPP
ncbi:uncharacterized protein RHO25_011416 [Cercospora beticola]|uniref:Vegetative incompatibility protein HET-E-1 n=2 Tax=Cercospora beticola TaxID=122368 RepID=A0ABZ0P4V8_CERBT|nr:hypothetical protein RHO25_011416 [Cercospora beticola]